jgi:flavodoxin
VGLVVFESMFGNTQVIASSVADGLAPRMQVDLMEVAVAPTALDGDVDPLVGVVGGPTHAAGGRGPERARRWGDELGAALAAEQRHRGAV